MKIEDRYVQDNVDFTQKYFSGTSVPQDQDPNAGVLDLSELDIEVDIWNIDQYMNEDYALLRKNGLGTSDSSTLLGVNPYKQWSELIAEKARNKTTSEEQELQFNTNIRKGNELEPVIISKHTQILGKKVIKPVHMYKSKSLPYLKFNFDGVIDKYYKEDGSYQYIPDEIKFISMYGVKYYSLGKAFFIEGRGYGDIPKPPVHLKSIEDKAAYYGIPPYYYTQLQQQIYGLNAPYGFLTVLPEKFWKVHSFFIWRDDIVIDLIKTQATKAWSQIENRREKLYPESFKLGVQVFGEDGEFLVEV